MIRAGGNVGDTADHTEDLSRNDRKNTETVPDALQRTARPDAEQIRRYDR